MSRRLVLALVVLAGGIAAGCASLIGVPDDTPSFCSQNTGHSFCADFDIGAPGWTQAVNFGSGQLGVEPSDAAPSPPNIVDLSAQAVPPEGGTSVAAFYASFDGGFSSLHIEAQMLFTGKDGQAFGGPTGIFVISDSAGGCVIAAAEQTGARVSIGGIPIPGDLCTDIINGTVSGSGDGGGGAALLRNSTPIGTLFLGAWQQVAIDVTVNPTGGGTLTMTSGPTGNPKLTIPPTIFPPDGTPSVIFSNASQPGANATDIQIDNVTIDVH